MTNNIEIKLEEVRQRCINIELKIDSLMDSDNSIYSFNGHPDQHFGHISYAQHGDDIIAINIFHNIGIRMPSYIDIGAHHPINISNTALLYRSGCRGINVEPNPNLIEEFYKFRPDDINLNVGASDQSGNLDFYMVDDYSGRNSFDLRSIEAFVRENPQFRVSEVRSIAVTTVKDIVDDYAGGIFPDFLSLDVEGLDLRILRSIFPNEAGPKVVCVEHTSGDSTVIYHEIRDFMAGVGYFPVFKTTGNAFFAMEKYRPLLQ